MASLPQQEASSSYEPALTVNVKPASKSRAGRGKAVGETGMHLKFLKLVLSILLGMVVLACLSLSQLSAISLVRYLRPNVTEGNVTERNFTGRNDTGRNDTERNVTGRNVTQGNVTEEDVTERCEAVSDSSDRLDRDVTTLMVVYMLMLPYGVSLLRSLWNGAFQDSVPWPHPKAFLVGAFLSICEVTGLCVLTLRVMPSVTPALSVVLSNGILFVSIVSQCIKQTIRLCKQKKRRNCRRVSRLVSCVIWGLSCGGLVGVWLFLRPFDNIDNRTQKYVIETVVSLFLLSLAWAPKLQEFQAQGVQSADSSKPDNARWKAGILNNLLKLVAVLLIPDAMKLAGLTDVCSSSWVWTKAELYAKFTMQHQATVSFVVNVTASFVGYILAWTACSIRMGFFGFALPAFLSTVVTGAIFTNQICTTVTFIHRDTCLMFMEEDFMWDVGIGLGLLLIQFFTTTWFVMRSPTIALEQEAQLFWLPGYNSVFPAQWLLLSRKNRNTKGEDFTTRRKTKQNTHVYICTTMYHESEREMEQLLTSLRALAENQVGERTFESHIFFDGGCRQGQPSQWALQLFSVMGRTLQDENDPKDILQQCTRYKTPYGLQLQWNLRYGSGDAASGMDFTVHLKDNVLVKNKKRWSQVMYMSYTLDYAAYFHPLGMASKVIADTDVRATSTYGNDGSHGPHQARLNAVGNGGMAGWTAEDSDIHQSLQIYLGEDMVVTGVLTQGKHGCEEWVTTYHLYYSQDSESWECYRDKHNKPAALEGNFDSDTPVQHILDTPIRARYVSFNPVSWKDRISMRVELLGYCATDLDRDSYILATDADIKFSPQSAKALMEIMSTDPSVGAVCGRTHPLGSGPMVWYQVFDYAIGHWFQKVANSVLGTVLCCPGCFSVYRCKAVRDTLATYASTVSKGEEFLTKDMGEDRWLCTLMVEKGWRLEYTAVSEDSTYCPEEFDEFFNQRRRWIPSTIANQLELIRKWGGGQVKSDYVSKFFIMYQGFLLFSSMIGPSTVILIMAAGLELVVGSAGGGILPTVIVLSLIFIGYGVLCLYAKQDTQLKWAKVLTMVFMVVMVIVLIGQAREMVEAFQDLDDRLKQQNANHISDALKSCLDCENIGCGDCKTLTCEGPLEWSKDNVSTWLKECFGPDDQFRNISGLFTQYSGLQLTLFDEQTLCDVFAMQNGDPAKERDCKLIFREFVKVRDENAAVTSPPPSTILDRLPLPMSVIYFLSLAALYLLTALLHPSEFHKLLYGFVYLLSLPSGYILMTIYSVCNMTDRSWGTREIKVPGVAVGGKSVIEVISNLCRTLCSCCRREDTKQPSVEEISNYDVDDQETVESESGSEDEQSESQSPLGDVKPAPANKSSLWGESGKGSVRGHRPSIHGTLRGHHRMFARRVSQQLIHDVSDFLPSQWPSELRQKYEKKFREHGYENTSFIFGMTNKDLEAIGITKKLHQNVLMKEIKKLPESELDDTIPENCRQWLESIGMEEYINSFETYGIISKDHLASLKSTDVDDLLNELKITKMAHIRRITNAIKKMKSPEETGRRIHLVKSVMKKVKTIIMQHDSTRSLEFKFWDKLRQECLDPEIALFSTDTDIRTQLVQLRNSWIRVLLVLNVMWITLIVSLTYVEQLKVLGNNPLSLLSLLVFGLLQLLQFLTMVYHRMRTLLHYLARLPYPASFTMRTKGTGSGRADVIEIEYPDPDADLSPGAYRRPSLFALPPPTLAAGRARRPSLFGLLRHEQPQHWPGARTNPVYEED